VTVHVRPGRWLSGVDIDGAEQTEGRVLIDVEHNADRLDAMHQAMHGAGMEVMHETMGEGGMGMSGQRHGP
jgi:hypothetical protein